MSAKANTKKWVDVQTIIATISVVLTLVLWNLFARNVESDSGTSAVTPTISPPPTETPESFALLNSFATPQVKIEFTPAPPPQQFVQQQSPKKNKNNGGSVTQTKSS